MLLPTSIKDQPNAFPAKTMMIELPTKGLKGPFTLQEAFVT